jgi:subtilisin family serine protease
LLTALALAVAPSAAHASDSVDLIVRRDAGLTAAERADVRAAAGVDHERSLRLSDTEVVSVPAADAAGALAELNADPDVRWAIRDGEVRATAAAEQDSSWWTLWGLQNTAQFGGVADADMDVPEAWELATGRGVTVAIVDSGVRFDHADLDGRLATNPGETGTDALGADKRSNGVDDDGNGLRDDWRGWDFMQGDNDPADVHGHGTHVTGTVVATNGNQRGISGVAPDARALTLRALGDDGRGSWSALADAFDLAGDLGVPVVNASLGGSADVSALLTPVVQAHPGTLYVVAAGNDSLDLDGGGDHYPCEVPAANLLCVGASDAADARASFSNYGATAVDLFAPGWATYSTCVDGAYCYKSGTSMATPHVAGAAALLAARNPTLSGADLKAALLATVEARPGLVSVTGGRANARAALDSVPADADGDGVLDGADPTPRGADGDGDGVPALDDDCPDVAGPAGNHGCPWPDRDGDGIDDPDDNCPDLATANRDDADGDGAGDACDATPRGGDADADGVPALDDECPSVAGPAENDGCPWPDRDADGTLDRDDDCPDTPGPADNGGCPWPDRDADGTSDRDDRCPDAAGPAGLNGCPPVEPPADRDRDGIADGADRCPDTAGPIGSQGCPPLPPPPLPPPPPVPPLPPLPPSLPPAAGTTAVTLSNVKVKLSKCSRGRVCTRRARVSVDVGGSTRLTLVLERRVRSKWVRQSTARASAAGRAAVSLTGALKPGNYRVTVSSTGGSARKTFRVAR